MTECNEECVTCGKLIPLKIVSDIIDTDGKNIISFEYYNVCNVCDMKYTENYHCDMCNGTGKIYLDSIITCHECGGSGNITFHQLPQWKKIKISKLQDRREFLESEVKIMNERYIPETKRQMEVFSFVTQESLEERLNYVKTCEIEIEEINKKLETDLEFASIPIGEQD
jgi:RecJ-like exonuclease